MSSVSVCDWRSRRKIRCSGIVRSRLQCRGLRHARGEWTSRCIPFLPDSHASHAGARHVTTGSSSARCPNRGRRIGDSTGFARARRKKNASGGKKAIQASGFKPVAPGPPKGNASGGALVRSLAWRSLQERPAGVAVEPHGAVHRILGYRRGDAGSDRPARSTGARRRLRGCLAPI